ncbi:MAG: sigma-70 family RNA polymerase sigma factor, partial [Planctomycetota bacterium]
MIEPSDLVQEVACRAWERMTTFDPNRGAFDGWIFGIARNVMGEALKRVARGGQNDWSTDRWTKVPDDATRVTARVARDETLGELVAWVADLP